MLVLVVEAVAQLLSHDAPVQSLVHEASTSTATVLYSIQVSVQGLHAVRTAHPRKTHMHVSALAGPDRRLGINLHVTPLRQVGPLHERCGHGGVYASVLRNGAEASR